MEAGSSAANSRAEAFCAWKGTRGFVERIWKFVDGALWVLARGSAVDLFRGRVRRFCALGPVRRLQNVPLRRF